MFKFPRPEREKLAAAGIHSLLDLALLLPKSFEDYRIAPTPREGACAVEVAIEGYSTRGSNLLVISAKNLTWNCPARLVIFNARPWHFGVFRGGKRLAIYAKAEFKFGVWQFTNPRVLKSSDAQREVGVKFGAGLGDDEILALKSRFISEESLAAQGLTGDEAAQLAFLNSLDAGALAAATNPAANPQTTALLKFVEAYNYAQKLSLKRTIFAAPQAELRDISAWLWSLPFKPTGDQLRAINQIRADFASPHAARRVVMGDVGSGKTLVMLAAALSLHPAKTALMAPTSVLAEQIYAEAVRLLPPDVRVVLVTGGAGAKNGGAGAAKNGAKSCGAGAKAGANSNLDEADLIIGTHALLWRELPPCALVMVDEQHKFGSSQRNKIAQLANGSRDLRDQKGEKAGAKMGAKSGVKKRGGKFNVGEIGGEFGESFEGGFGDDFGADGGLNSNLSLFELASDDFVRQNERQNERETRKNAPKSALEFGEKLQEFVEINGEKIPTEILQNKSSVAKNDDYISLSLDIDGGENSGENLRENSCENSGENPQNSSPAGLKTAPHFLQFSATPIPRTLALMQSNFVQFSFLRELPFEKNIHTRVIKSGDFAELLAHLEREFAANRQAIVVYPLVEESRAHAEATNSAQNGTQNAAQNATSKAAQNATNPSPAGLNLPQNQVQNPAQNHPNPLAPRPITYQSLAQVESFWRGRFERVFLTHGGDKNKGAVLEKFRDEGNLLLATTLVEVGISLPRLSTIVIVGAERLGLASLHQLRGRVGRNGGEGWAFLFTKLKTTPPRLVEFARTLDGFEIARLDLANRKGGDVLEGRVQHGEQFRWLDIAADDDIARAAHERLEKLGENRA